MRRDKCIDPPVGRNRLFDPQQEGREEAPAGAAVHQRQCADADERPRQPQLGPLSQLVGIAILGTKIPQEIGPEANTASEPEPEAVRGFLPGQLGVRNGRVVVGQVPQQTPIAQLVLHDEGKMNVVPPFGELPHGGREVSDRPGMPHREENLHCSESANEPASASDQLRLFPGQIFRLAKINGNTSATARMYPR